MSWNGTGGYQYPTGQPVASGTLIASATFNTYTADIGNMFANVVTRDGQGTFTGQAKFFDGTVTAPGISFNSESSTGFYRAAAGTLAISILGVQAANLTATGLSITGSITASGAGTSTNLNVTGSAIPTNGIYLPAANTLGFATNGASVGSVNSTGNWSISGTTGNTLTVNTSNTAFTAGSTAYSAINISNSATSFQTMLDFSHGSTLTGRFRSDYAGNMTHVATLSGVHGFYCGGDNGVGTLVLTLASGSAVFPGYINVGAAATLSAGDISVARTSTTGCVYFGSSIAHYLYFDGTNYNFASGNISSPGGSITGNFGTLTTPTSYGSVGISGSNGGWAGAQFSGSYRNQTLMVSTSSDSSGMYDLTGGWMWRFDGSALAVGTVPAASISAGTAGISISGNAATSSSCSGNAATVSMSSGRTDGTAYPVVWGTATATSQLYSCSAVTITSSTGTLTATAVSGTSDARLKDNIATIDNALDKVTKLDGVTFNWKATGKKATGLIAQNVQEVMPEAVVEGEYLSIQYGNLVGLLVEAIKELKAEVDALKGK